MPAGRVLLRLFDALLRAALGGRAPMPDDSELLRACDRLGGRARLALVARVLEAQPRESFAGGLGISAEAGDVMLFRALAELEAALAGVVNPPAEALEDAEERAAAAALARALDGGATWAGGGGPRVERRVALCQALRDAPEVKAALVQPPPPPPTLRERARRLVWLALVVVAAILYSWWRPG
ncbi:MAG TPA: hypothetical protein VFA20_25140 [Myxococcaceae bacterium]|nr:hypothetical protein [Myxococcaceae bacterium]